MKRNLKFILALIKMKLSHMMVFRLSFFGAFFVDGSLFLIQILTFQAIYSQVDSIGGWSRGEMIIFIGTFSMINALNMVIFFFGVITIPDKIKNGQLDHYITKPVSPLLRLTFENVNPGSIPLLFLSVGIITYGISLLEITVTPLRVIGYIILVLIMTVLWYDIELLLRIIPLFTVSAYNFSRLEDSLLDVSMKIPGVLLKGVFKLILYLVIPYGIMSTFPTQFITNTLSPGWLAYGCGIVILFTYLTGRIWKLGLKYYKSASS
ncbi:ABC-2 family transporter protein [Mobilitalea sibirica]|uniref:ABC-2 family transporter protein n=1 Tax=Mobilitalea sibirica TaxID=1462919 RepID=A0A8J7H2V9_9FIRM|nr:ABC-2 family transporter protein [Mobilitalea sibirica]MBH1940980.1 ABC-2 family transporter protein [Mobilitalea sibirica]